MSEIITIDKVYTSLNAVIYCDDLHKIITERKPFQLIITINDKARTMTMPQAITILSTGKTFLDYAAFN